jgi:hypothetical protein
LHKFLTFEQKVNFIVIRHKRTAKKIDLLGLPIALKLISRDDFMTMLSVLMNFMGIMLNQFSQELRTCANEYAHEEYIPANLSRHNTVRSVATRGITVEQLFMPKKMMAVNIEPSTLKRSCWSFLPKQEKIVKSVLSIMTSSFSFIS